MTRIGTRAALGLPITSCSDLEATLRSRSVDIELLVAIVVCVECVKPLLLPCRSSTITKATLKMNAVFPLLRYISRHVVLSLLQYRAVCAEAAKGSSRTGPRLVCPSLPWDGSFSPFSSPAVSSTHSVIMFAVFMIRLSCMFLLVSCSASFAAEWTERTVCLAYHKPKGVVVTHATDDVKGRRNVYQDIATMRGFVGETKASFENTVGSTLPFHAIGRLDADTSGLLLVTNDGGLLHHVTNKLAASRQDFEILTKTYEALIMGQHGEQSELFQTLRNDGVDIGDKYGGITKPVINLHVLEHPTSSTTSVRLSINEGKNRQVRRMFHALGSGVMRLKRVAIGDELTLQNLDEGEWKILPDAVLSSILGWESRVLDTDKLLRRKRSRDRPRRRTR